MAITITVLALIIAAALGHMAASGGQVYVVMGLLGVIVSMFAFMSPKASITLLVFSMLLSPKIGFGAVGGGREAVLRYDDILLVIIFFSWLARTAVFKTRPFITSTPAQAPVLLYTAAAVLSTALGVMRGNVSAKESFFYVLKYAEYFFLYFMTVNIVETRDDVRRYLRYGLLVAIAVTFYAFYYYHGAGPDARATAPFEAVLGSRVNASEPASLGGYYLVIFGALMAFMTEYSGKTLFLLAGALAFMFPAFLLTFSRSSYIGFTLMVPALLLFTKRRRLSMFWFILAGMLALLAMPTVMGKVADRITMTYRGEYATEVFRAGPVGNIRLEDSAAARLRSLQRVFLEQLPEHPIFGWGVTGVGLCDTQYALVLGETGILGGLLFFWLLYRLFYTARKVYLLSDDRTARGLALGFAVTLVGLLFQSVGVNSFIIIRIMEPFWFVAALLSVEYLRVAPAVPRTGTPPSAE
jgi:hypothetical protein